MNVEGVSCGEQTAVSTLNRSRGRTAGATAVITGGPVSVLSGT
jgi:hypothetical protein